MDTQRVKAMEIGGYRGFGESALLHLAVPSGDAGSGLTVITGPNSAGKSSLLESLRLLGSRNLPLFGRSVRNPNADGVFLEYLFSDDSRVRLKSEGSRGLATSWVRLVDGQEEELRTGPLQGRVVFVPASRSLPPFAQQSPLRFDDYSWVSIEQQRDRNSSPDLGRLLMTIAQDRALKSMFDEVVTRLLGYDVDWELDAIETGDTVFSIASSTGDHTTDGLGHGIMTVFFIAAASVEGSGIDLVLIDEPEASLHPQVQRRVAEFLFELAAARQVVIATHSPYFVDPYWFPHGVELARCYVGVGSTRVSRLSEQSKSRITGILNDLHNPHVFGLDAREVFFATGDRPVLLLEGQDDVQVLVRRNPDLHVAERFEVFGWGAGGATKMRAVLAVLSDLGVSRAATILDQNMAGLVNELEQEFPQFVHVLLPAADIRDKPARESRPASVGVATSSGVLKDEYRHRVSRLLSDVLARVDAV